MIEKVAIYGAGSWGTALALLLARNGLDVLLWDINAEHVSNLQQDRENKHFLPGIPFPDNLNCTAELDEMTAHSLFQLIVVPSHGFRALLQQIKPQLQADHRLFWATKGIELDTGLLLHEVIESELPEIQQYGLVSGPTFAAEVAKGLPTAITLAANDVTIADEIAHAFQGETFRVYTSDDVIGVELGGSIKNVLAIAAGISDGLGYGANARAAIITRGLAEIMRLGEKLGAKSETLMGLAGVGDLVLTCTDNQSRNRRLGLALGKGKSLDGAIQEIGQAIEGLKSSHSIGLLAQKAGVEMPICQQVYQILYKDLSPQQAVKVLLSRDLKSEF
jgi:glycerol-3-phosphate dehydrogenase (NAD(P)+)